MRLVVLTALTCFSLALCPAARAWSRPPEDLEGSGDDPEHDMEDDMDGDMEGSGSGSGSQEKETVEGKITDLGFGREDTGPKKKEKSGGADFELEPEHPWDRTPRVIQSKSIMESKEVLTGVVAGGVGGLILAVALAGFLIYKWKKKDLAQEYRAARSTETGQDYIRDQKGALRDETVVLV